MTLILDTAPAAEPVSLAEAKLQIGVSDTAQDALIARLITGAREVAERLTRRRFVTQTWTLACDAFPEYRLEIPLPPLQSIEEVAYIDTAGASQTLAADTDYQLVLGELGAIVPAYGKVWPSTRAQPDAVTITFVCGYGDAAAVPANIKDQLMLMIGHGFEHREEEVLGTTTSLLKAGGRRSLLALRDPRWL